VVKWVDIAGNEIASGVAVESGALQSPAVSSPVLTNVYAGDEQNTIDASTVPGATQYNLYWKLSAGVTNGDNQIADVTFPYDHTSLSNGTEYFYVATAIVGGVETNVSNELSGTPAAVAPPILLLYAVN